MTKKRIKKIDAEIRLGSLVKDTITGYTGVAVGRLEFGYGCIHIRVQAAGLTREGEPIAVHSFDDQRIEVLAPPEKLWPEAQRTNIKMGNVVRDRLTGAVGTVTGKSLGLDGRLSLLLEPSGLTADGEPKTPLYVHADRAVVVDRRELDVSKDSVATCGGPMARSPLAG